MGTRSEVIPGYVREQDRPKHTPAYKIWHYNFICYIAQMHLMSPEYIRQSGTVTTGNSAIDRAMAEEKVQVQLTVAAMADFHHEGVNFALAVPEDSAKIYQMIFDHLTDWRLQIEANPHTVDVPFEELKKLDKLAEQVYPHARLYLREQPFHGKLLDTVMHIRHRRGGIGRAAPVAPVQPGTYLPPPVQAPHKAATSVLTESMQQYPKGHRKPWR